MVLFDFKPLITVVLGTVEPLTLYWHLSKTLLRERNVDFAHMPEKCPIKPSVEGTVHTLKGPPECIVSQLSILNVMACAASVAVIPRGL